MFDYFRNVHVNEDNEHQRNSTKLTDPISVYFGNSFIVSKCIFLLNIEFYFAKITMRANITKNVQWSQVDAGWGGQLLASPKCH